MATLDDLNLNKFLYRITPTNESSIFNISKEEQKAINEVASENIMSGEMMGDISLIDGFFQSKNFISGSTGWQLNNDGVIECQDAIIGGAITATSGDIGGWDIILGYIYSLASGTPASSPSDGIVLASGNKVIQVFENTEKRVEMGCLSAGVYGIKGYADDGITVLFELSDTQKLFTGIPITSLPIGTDLSLLSHTHDIEFSSTDYRTISWTSGTITFSNGKIYSIVSGNTGNMATKTYIYLDPTASITVLQITTSATTAHGVNKIPLVVAVNNADITSKADLVVYGATGGKTILVDNIAANSASTNEFISNTAQIKDAIITSAKIDSLTANKITAGTGIVNALSVLNTLTMGNVERNGIIQSYGWNGTVNGFQIIGGATPTINIIGGVIECAEFSVRNGYGKFVDITNDDDGKIIITTFATEEIGLLIRNTEIAFNNPPIVDYKTLVKLLLDNPSTDEKALAIYSNSRDAVAKFEAKTNINRVSPTVSFIAVSGQGAHFNCNPIATAPASPTEGDFYANTDHHLYYYNGTAWKQLDNA